MKRSQLLVVLAAVVAVVAIGLGSRGDEKKDGEAAKTSTPTPAPTNAIVVSVASSPEKLDLVENAAAAYNRTSPRVNDRPVVVQVRSANSGDEEAAIARGERSHQPVVWSPASSLWARLLEYDADRDLVPDDPPSIVRSPLVLAMWEPLARSLGWPDKPIGFDDVLRLAQDPRGWAAYGHPEYGAFKLVHTNPSVSTSGLEAVSGAYFALTGKKEGLTVADVDRPDVQRKIAKIEQSIVHYGDTTLFIKEQLRKHGPGYASVVAMEETTLFEFNEDRGGQPKLVAIYPAEGTFVSDSPYIILKAPWVDANEGAGATAFQRFLSDYVTPEIAARAGLRPPNPDVAPVAPVDAAHGVDRKQPVRVLVPPQPAVLDHIRQAWFENRKAANIMLVVDTSGSMNDYAKLAHAKKGLQGFLKHLSPRDRVGLTTFSTEVHPLVPIRPFAQNRDELRSRVRDLIAEGDTALYEAAEAAVDDVAALQDESRINAVVLLGDGQNTILTTTMNDLVPKLESHTGQEANAIRVFTIAYGKDAVGSVLDRIASTSDGKAYKGDTEDIEAVYRGISSFF
jgi:Ca-activated chloride channel homolog